MKEITVTIRKAILTDLPHIINLASDAIVYSISPYRDVSKEKAEEFRKEDLKDLEKWIECDDFGGIYVAETESGKICGHVIMASGYFDLTGEKLGWILDITVSQDFMGTGLSRELHNFIEKIFINKGVKAISLGVTSSNKRAINFYKKLGYKEEHIQLLKVM